MYCAICQLARALSSSFKPELEASAPAPPNFAMLSLPLLVLLLVLLLLLLLVLVLLSKVPSWAASAQSWLDDLLGCRHAELASACAGAAVYSWLNWGLAWPGKMPVLVVLLLLPWLLLEALAVVSRRCQPSASWWLLPELNVAFQLLSG